MKRKDSKITELNTKEEDMDNTQDYKQDYDDLFEFHMRASAQMYETIDSLSSLLELERKKNQQLLEKYCTDGATDEA